MMQDALGKQTIVKSSFKIFNDLVFWVWFYALCKRYWLLVSILLYSLLSFDCNMTTILKNKQTISGIIVVEES